MFRLMIETEHIQCEGQAIQCRIRLLEHKYMQKKENSTARGTSSNRRDKQNSVFKIINEMTLTFVLVYCEDAMFSGSIKDYVIIFNNNFV